MKKTLDLAIIPLMLLNVAALLYFCLPNPAHAATSDTGTTTAMFTLTNAERAKPVVWDYSLAARAQLRADFLCKTGQWSHDGWLDSFKGYPYRFAGENLAKGFDSPVAANLALMASPTHRANIVKPEYTRMGVGYACGIEVELFAGK